MKTKIIICKNKFKPYKKFKLQESLCIGNKDLNILRIKSTLCLYKEKYSISLLFREFFHYMTKDYNPLTIGNQYKTKIIL